jgi:hypothetical protein
MPDAVTHFGGRLMTPATTEQVISEIVLAFLRDFQQSGPADTFVDSVKRIPQAELEIFVRQKK